MPAAGFNLCPRRASLRVVAVCGGILVVGLLAGCAGYRVGPTGGQVAQARSVRVNFLSNRTIEPRLSEPLTQALRRNLQQDGTFRLSSREGDADLVVGGSITVYERKPMAFQPRDLASVQEYELRVTVKVVAKDAHTGAVVLDRAIRGRTTVSVGADLGSAERQATSLLADDFARNATTALVEGAW